MKMHKCNRCGLASPVWALISLGAYGWVCARECQPKKP
jgi:hypothetical protein